jgi:hypothetical protein
MMIPPGLAKLMHAVDSLMASLSVLFVFGFVAILWRMTARHFGSE